MCDNLFYRNRKLIHLWLGAIIERIFNHIKCVFKSVYFVLALGMEAFSEIWDKKRINSTIYHWIHWIPLFFRCRILMFWLVIYTKKTQILGLVKRPASKFQDLLENLAHDGHILNGGYHHYCHIYMWIYVYIHVYVIYMYTSYIIYYYY